MKKRIIAIFLVLLLTASLAIVGCGTKTPVETQCTHTWAEGVCEKCQAECIHQWNGDSCDVCAMVCTHDWDDGVCIVCGAECAHEVFEERRCAVCNIRCPHKTHDQTTLLCNDCGREVSHVYTYEDYVNGKCTMCGETTMFVWELGGVDETLKDECERQGTIETVTYTTHAYAVEDAFGESDLIIEKTMYVYLPYGYSEDQQYDVLYLLHGAGEDEGYWLGVGNYTPDLFSKYQATNYVKNILDNMIDKGLCKPLIVVTPTLYSDVEGYELDQLNLTAHFGKELKNDIMPVIAEKYSTYAQGTTAENFIAARDHHAYAAFSMGSMTGFQSVMTYCIDYISYIASYSGGYSPDNNSLNAGVESIVNALNGEYKDYKINYWFNANGTMDNARDGHVKTYELMLERLPDRFAEGENCIFIDLPGGAHTYPSWEVDLYNTLLLFFQ